MRPQVGQLVNNKYRLLRLIGDGGMGSVFEARHEVLGTSVALKFLHAELTRRAGLVQRFLQEARVVARIQSPHVVRVSDVDQTPEGNAFIVMEFIEGKSLQAVYEDLYRAGKRLSFADAMDYALQMLDGLEVAHASGIVHRDLKPDNVMITRGAKGASLLKVLDFGIAKLKVEGEHMKGLTRPGVVMGTPEYMAPEQAFSADQVDARADIFAFGVMFFEMLAGRRPVGGDEPHQIAAQYLAGEVAKLTDLAPQVPPGLAEVVHKAMAAQAKDRWSSVVELRQAIEPFADGARGAAGLSTKPSNRPAAGSAAAPVAASPIKSDGEPNPSAAAQVMASVGAVAAASSALGSLERAASDVDGGATEKVDGLPEMMLAHGGTAEGLGPSRPGPAPSGPLPPIVAPSPAGPSPLQNSSVAVSPVQHSPVQHSPVQHSPVQASPSPNVTPTHASSPAITPVPQGQGWGGTEAAEYDPLRPGAGFHGANGYTATEGFSPLVDVRPGGTDVGAPRVGGTAIDPGAPAFHGTAPMTPAGLVFSAPPAIRRKKSGGLGWMLFLATTVTGAVLGGVFLWDQLDLGSDPKPKTTQPGRTVAPQLTTPPAPATTTPPAPATTPTTPPAPPPTTPPAPPPTQPRPQPTQPRPQPSQQPAPQPSPSPSPTFQWPAPTLPSSLPGLIPITPPPSQPDPPQPQPQPQQPDRPQPQPQPSSTRPKLPRPRIPGRGTNTQAPTDSGSEHAPAGTKPAPQPSTSSSSRPKIVVVRKSPLKK